MVPPVLAAKHAQDRAVGIVRNDSMQRVVREMVPGDRDRDMGLSWARVSVQVAVLPHRRRN